MDSAPVISPSSDERFWSKLRDRVDTILEDRNPKHTLRSSSSTCAVESERGKRFSDDSLLLIRGLDSVASSLTQLTDALSSAQQGVSDLAKPTNTKASQRERQRAEDEDVQPQAKRHCGSDEHPDKHQGISLDKLEGTGSGELPGSKDVTDSDELKGEKQMESDVAKSGNLKKAKNLAISMAGKAASLARELKTIKSELCFMQERCTLLEEENRRFREGMEKGVRPEEDDLVRLQLEALLAEKSRLANENANLTRENQCLHQLVEYHQLTSQDLSASYELALQGMRLDFSSPLGRIDSDSEGENNYGDTEASCTPLSDKLGFTPSLDEHCKEQ